MAQWHVLLGWIPPAGNPLAATYSYNLVNHEEGVDDNETGTTAPIHAFVASAEFDLEDGTSLRLYGVFYRTFGLTGLQQVPPVRR